MLELIEYPVSLLLRFWHAAFETVGVGGGAAWMFAVAFVGFTVRAAYLPLSFAAVRQTARWAALRPQIERLEQITAGNPDLLAARKRSLLRENRIHPFVPLLVVVTYLPVNAAVLVGLYFLVGRPDGGGSNALDAENIESFSTARFLDVPIAAGFGDHGSAVAVMALVLTLSAAVFAHLRARIKESDRRDQNRFSRPISLYVFPLAVCVFLPFVSVAMLGYFFACNLWDWALEQYFSRRRQLPTPVSADSRV